MKKRTLLLSMVVAGLALAVWSHQPPLMPTDASDDDAWTWVEDRSRTIAYANHPVAGIDSVSEREALQHVERLHRTYADLLRAMAYSDDRRTEHLLDEAMRELQTLLGKPGLPERPRFQSAFRSITAEYESRYGVPDTLDLPRGDIYGLRRGLFAALNSDDAPLIENVMPSDLRVTHTDVPMTINERVRESMAFLIKNRNLHLYPWLRRTETYFPMIEHIFAEENVPDELKYLALVESGLNPHAHSHAQAAGIWQFVATTGRRYGLTVDPWVDERRDPEKATRAAARHLRDLYELFGDWHLALAGYNCSPSVIRRAIRKARSELDREPTFWDIYEDLPEETRNYVPLFIATSVIISNPAEFDLKRVTPGPRYAFDHVPVDASLTLAQVADLARVDVAKVRALNPELRGERVPPSAEPYYVRLPYGTYEAFAENYRTLPDEERATLLQHAVQGGETVGQIAQRYHVSRPSLMQQNEMQTGRLQAGQRLSVPAATYVGNSEIVSDADARPIRVRYGSRATRPVAVDAMTTADASRGTRDGFVPAASRRR